MRQIIHSAFSQFISTAYPGYGGITGYTDGDAVNWSTDEHLITSPWPVSGTFRNFKVRVQVAPGAGKTITYTLRKNGVNTALTVTISGTSVTATDTTHSFSISAGDDIVIERTATGGTPATSGTFVHLEFDSTTTGQSGYTYVLQVTPGEPSQPVQLIPIFSGTTGNSEASVNLHVVPIAGAITRYDIVNYGVASGGRTALAGGESLQFVIVKNSVEQDGTGSTVSTTATLSGASSAVTWTGNLPIAVGDTLYMNVVDSAGITQVRIGIACQFTATTDGDFILGTSSGPFGTLPVYTIAGGTPPQLLDPDPTEVNIEGIGGPTTWWINGFVLGVNGDPSGGSFKVLGRVNEATPTNTAFTTIAGVDSPSMGVMLAASAVGASGVYATEITDADRWAIRWEDYTAPQMIGSTVFGVHTKLRGVRSVSFGLDGATHTDTLDGTVWIHGDLIVDGTMTGAFTADISAALSALGE